MAGRRPNPLGHAYGLPYRPHAPHRPLLSPPRRLCEINYFPTIDGALPISSF